MDWQAFLTPAVVLAAYWSLRREIGSLRHRVDREIGSLRDRVDRLAEDVAFIKGALTRPPDPAN